MSCSLWYELKIGCVMNGDERANAPSAGETDGASDAAVNGARAPLFSAASSRSRSPSLVVSSIDTPTVLASMRRTLAPSLSAAATTLSASGTVIATVSKNGAAGTPRPSFFAPAASVAARPCTRSAISVRPLGPW